MRRSFCWIAKLMGEQVCTSTKYLEIYNLNLLCYFEYFCQDPSVWKEKKKKKKKILIQRQKL